MSRRRPSLPSTDECVHCGLCLPACPTYRLTGRETHSPRGRVAALRRAEEECAEPSPALHEGLEDCLICRACESLCPAGVDVEALLEEYHRTRRQGPQPLGRRLESWLLERVLPRPRRRSWALSAAGLAASVARSLPGRAILGGIDVPRRARTRRPAPLRVPEPLHRRGRVVVFRGCVADRWFRAELQATVDVLARNGWEVRAPEVPCCGALHRHAGLVDEAGTWERRSAAILLAEEPDYVVVDVAGCAAALLQPHSGGRAAEVARRTVDTLTLLDREGYSPPRHRLPGAWRVAPACHLRHGPLDEAPHRRVLDAILEDGYLELPPPDHCCGAAGLYALRRRASSRAIGAVALERFIDSGGTGVLSANAGCLLRWESLLAPRSAEAIHPVVALARAYGGRP